MYNYGQKMDTCMYEDIFKAARNLMFVFEKSFELNFFGGYRIFLVFFGQIRSFIASIEDEQQIFAHKMNKYTKIYVLIIIKTLGKKSSS